MMEQRIPRPAAPSTSCARPLTGRPHPAEPGRGAAAGPTLRPARGMAEAARPLRPASSVAEAARRRLPAHRPQGSLPRPDQEDCGDMFLDLERDRVFLHLLFFRFAMFFCANPGYISKSLGRQAVPPAKSFIEYSLRP